MPWEINEQSLQVNTCARNAEDMSDTKEQKTNLDVKNSPKIRISIIKNSSHEKSPVNTENQKDPKLDTYKEINGINTSEKEVIDTYKKEVIELNSQHLNEALVSLSPKVSEDDRDLSTFLDLSSPDMMANDEQLDMSKEKKNFSATGSSTEIDRKSVV